MVLIGEPPPKRQPRPLHAILQEGTELYRIYDPTRPGVGRLTFRTVGPLRRFDHHVKGSRVRGIYYAALSLDACVVEVFGDAGTVALEGLRVANPVLRRDLRLLDLRGRGAMRAGTVAAISSADHSLSQAWSRHFYEEPGIYGEIDGLIYPNAHNGDDAVALYERARGALRCPPARDWPLEDPVIDAAIREIAHENNLIPEM